MNMYIEIISLIVLEFDIVYVSAGQNAQPTLAEELTDYYFLITDGIVSDEVYSYDYQSNTDELIAKNFINFLIQEIPKNYSL